MAQSFDWAFYYFLGHYIPKILGPITQTKVNAILPPPSIPPARGGKLVLLPLDGGGREGVK